MTPNHSEYLAIVEEQFSLAIELLVALEKETICRVKVDAITRTFLGIL